MELKKGLDEIIIVAMGPSWYQCPKEKPYNSEIWGVNTMYRNRDLDRIFIMHDIKYDILTQDRDFVDSINTKGMPVYTAGDYPPIKNNIPYPTEEVIQYFGVGFFLNVMGWMLALAIMQKPKRITLYGVDMRSDSGDEYRLGERGCIEFWLGMAMGKGIDIGLPQESFLLKRVMRGNFYGYHFRKNPKGLDELIPVAIKRQYQRFKLLPIDATGKTVEEDALGVTLKG